MARYLCTLVVVSALLVRLDIAVGRPQSRDGGGHGHGHGHGHNDVGHGGYGGHHYYPHKSKGSSLLYQLIEFPKGIAIGFRRFGGGLIALKGGWVRGQGAWLHNYALKEKGQHIIDFGKYVAGPGPYGPKAPF